MRFSETPVRRGDAAPLLGADSSAVLSSLGYTESEVSDLLRRGVIRQPAAAMKP